MKKPYHFGLNKWWFPSLLLIGLVVPSGVACAQEKEPATDQSVLVEPKAEESPALKPIEFKPDGDGAIRKLMPEMPVWIDTKRKMVIMDGEVCLRKGSLEMFACLKGTKEHESVIAVATDAYVVHAGLLAVGAKQGKPVEFDPKYVPPSGEIVDVVLQWDDENGKVHTAKAQDWVRDAKTKKSMKYDWVFPGSYFWKDIPIEDVMKAREEGKDPAKLPGKMVYAAEGGELICVSNFRSSMLDVPVPSSDANDDLWFEAFTENIPKEGTKVRVFLIPQKDKEQSKEAEEEAKIDEAPKPE